MFHTSRTWYTVAPGDTLPSVRLHGRKGPGDAVDALAFFKPYRRAILIGVPGAFTPGCSKASEPLRHRTHLPSYIKAYDELKRKGVEKVVCVTVNDAFVAQAWADQLGAGDKVILLADPKAELVKSLGLSFDASGACPLGGIRSKRFAMVLEHGKVIKLNVEPDATGLTCSLADNVMKDL
ncbi:Redoxin [Syncephalis pseudoplumigaleata]|uniref:Redoxin n=1 Tax=Syncephalis pseudoplumigaleata TaxID=1712513 RepID=A0A4P9Z1I1_9FUNG|nr:Redoxin [Syncephalis pseudoplumigaleata]|eukprot:RKP25792.1 Redoxin [Syncephalis pseudoplumigaleata]